MHLFAKGLSHCRGFFFVLLAGCQRNCKTNDTMHSLSAYREPAKKRRPDIIDTTSREAKNFHNIGDKLLRLLSYCFPFIFRHFTRFFMGHFVCVCVWSASTREFAKMPVRTNDYNNRRNVSQSNRPPSISCRRRALRCDGLYILRLEQQT